MIHLYMNLFFLIVPGGDTTGEEELAERISAYRSSARMKEQAMCRDLDIMYDKLSAFKVKNEKLEKVLMLVKKERSDYQDECEKLKEELKKVKQQSYEFEVKSEELQREVDMFQQKESCKCTLCITLCVSACATNLPLARALL